MTSDSEHTYKAKAINLHEHTVWTNSHMFPIITIDMTEPSSVNTLEARAIA
jgi:hypothetical protein